MPARIEERLKKLIKKDFNCSFMSNSKWRKLFLALAPLNLEHAYWKFVDCKDEFLDRFVEEKFLMERFIGDCCLSIGEPFAYRRIQWVEIPEAGINHQYEKISYINFKQDIEAIESILESIGEFEIEITERGIRIYGHK